MSLQLTSSKLAKTGSKSKTTKPEANIAPKDRELVWTEKYKPKNVADIPIYGPKIKAVREWLNNALEIHQVHTDLGALCAPCFLAICGNSGCCKTSTVQLLCKEEGITIVEWSQNMWESEATTAGFQDNIDAGMGEFGASSAQRRAEFRAENTYDTALSSGYSSTARDLFKVEGVTRGAWSSKADALETFALQSHYPSLILQTKTSSNTSNNIAPSSSSSGGLSRTVSNTSTSNTPRTPSNEVASNTRKIILLKDPPSYDTYDSNNRVYNTEYAERLQNMYNFILSFQCPVVMILSDVSGRDDFQFAAERCLPQRIKQRLQFESMYFTPVTEIKIAKVLDGILKQEHLERSSKRHMQIVQEISASCMGDIRHAVMQLQLLLGNADHTLQPSPCLTAHTSTSIDNVSMHRSMSLPAPTTTRTSINTSSTTTGAVHSAPSSSKYSAYKPTAEVVDLVSDEDMAALSKAQHSNSSGKVSAIKRSSTYGSIDGSDVEVVDLGPSKRRKNNRIIQDSESSGDEYLPHSGVITTAALGSRAAQNSSVGSEVKVVSRARSGSALDRAHSIQDNHDMSAIASSSGATVVSKRDHSYSSLHSVGKLLNAKLDLQGMLKFEPDAVIDRSELSPDLLLAFMQWNWVGSLMNTPRIYPPIVHTSNSGVYGSADDGSGHYSGTMEVVQGVPSGDYADGGSTSGAGAVEYVSESAIALREIQELETALALFSEVEIYTTRKYDTSMGLDRSGASAYPDAYISSILSRSAACSRGTGSAEDLQYAKTKGYKDVLRGVFRPKALDLRTRSAAVRSKLNVIQEELLLTSTITSNPATVPASAPSSSYNCAAPGPTPALQHLHHQQHQHQQDVHHQRIGHSAHTSAQLVQNRFANTSNTTTNTHGMPQEDAAVSSSVVSMLSHREIVLNTVPYYKLIAHTVRSKQAVSRAYSNGVLQSTPVYSERLDWMIDNVYNPHQQYTMTRAGGSNVTSVAQAQQSVVNVAEVDDVISDFD